MKFWNGVRWIAVALWFIFAAQVFFTDWEPQRWLIGAAFIGMGCGGIMLIMEDRL